MRVLHNRMYSVTIFEASNTELLLVVAHITHCIVNPMFVQILKGRI